MSQQRNLYSVKISFVLIIVMSDYQNTHEPQKPVQRFPQIKQQKSFEGGAYALFSSLVPRAVHFLGNFGSEAVSKN